MRWPHQERSWRRPPRTRRRRSGSRRRRRPAPGPGVRRPRGGELRPASARPGTRGLDLCGHADTHGLSFGSVSCHWADCANYSELWVEPREDVRISFCIGPHHRTSYTQRQDDGGCGARSSRTGPRASRASSNRRHDRQLLRLLTADARLPNNALAEAVGIAPSTCLNRIRQLRDSGVIRGFHADVDPAALGWPLRAMIAVRLRAGARDRMLAFLDRIRRRPEVVDGISWAGPTTSWSTSLSPTLPRCGNSSSTRCRLIPKWPTPKPI